jgi:hypothetical protein
MIENGFDYNKTVDSKRLVFKGQLYQKVVSYIFMAILIALGLVISYKIFESQTSGNPSHMDYIVALIFPLIILLVVIYECSVFLNRDKLKEIESNLQIDLAKGKLLEAASNLKWEPYVINDNYIVFKTKFGFVKDCQTVTLIIFPDNRIYFNSLNYPNDYIKPARYMDNYKALVDEFLRIEKE